MRSLNRTKKFYIVSICSVFMFTIIDKILFVLYRAAASDILIVGASSFALRALPYICSFGAELFSRGALVMAVCSAVYAVSYFGKKTSFFSVLSSVLCLIAGEALLFLYNITRNVVGRASILAWLLSTSLELLFSAAILAVTVFIAYRYTVKRFHAPLRHRLQRYAPIRAVLLSLGIACILHVVILSADKVIPFFIKYQDITSKEIADIAMDYGYYIFWHLGISFALSFPCLKILEKATGRLRPKDYKASLTEKNDLPEESKQL